MSLVTAVTNFPNGTSQGQGVASELGSASVANIDNPGVAVANRYVASVNMANGAYTLAQTAPADGLARNVVATITGVTGNDTPGSILVTGTNVRGEVITETIALVAAGTATGVKAFKTVTSIVQSGWVINTGNDTIVIGTGNAIGLSVVLTSASQFQIGWLGGVAVAAVIGAGGTLETSTIDMSSATYDGAKDIRALLRI